MPAPTATFGARRGAPTRGIHPFPAPVAGPPRCPSRAGGALHAPTSAPLAHARVKSMTQFVSQVLPPSAEYACSQRASFAPSCDQRKRVRTGRSFTVRSA